MAGLDFSGGGTLVEDAPAKPDFSSGGVPVLDFASQGVPVAPAPRIIPRTNPNLVSGNYGGENTKIAPDTTGLEEISGAFDSQEHPQLDKTPLSKIGLTPEGLQTARDFYVSKLPASVQPAAKMATIPTLAIDKTIAGVADWASTPKGAMQLVASGIPVVRIPMAIKFFHDMAKGAGQSASDMVDKWQAGDSQGFADSLAATAANTLGAGFLGHGALGMAKADLLPQKPVGEPEAPPATPTPPARQNAPQLTPERKGATQNIGADVLDKLKPAAPAQEGATSVPHSEKPSEVLPVRSQTPAPPRPQRNGRDTTAMDAWDEQFGTMRKGGRTHNDDGTPYQPTVLDEVMVDVRNELSAAKNKDEASFKMAGQYMTLGLGKRIKVMLDAGWKWDSKEKRMVNPNNPTQKASQFEKEAATEQPTPPPSPSPKPAQAQEGVKEPWQIPVEKFVDDNTEKKVTHRNLTAVTRQASALRARHADEVSAAVKAGKLVPPEVLADYPDLVKPSPSVVKPLTQKQRAQKYYRDLAKQEFPSMPDATADSLASYLSETKGVMQSDELSPNEAMRRAVRAYIRHRKTGYESNFGDDIDRGSNRAFVGNQIDAIYDEWRGVSSPTAKPEKPRVPTQEELKSDPNAWSVTYSWDKDDPTKRHTAYGPDRADLENYIVSIKKSFPDVDPKEEIKPNTPSQNLEPPKPGEIVGMGGAVPSEFGEGGAGQDIYGIAARVRDQRAKSGQVASIPTGESISAADSVEHGRELLKQGADAEKAISNFESTGKTNADDIALTRAYGEQLALAARRIEEKFGTTSKEYQLAWKSLSEWDSRTKGLQSEWHRMGMAQQGETDIDTGTFTGLQQAYHADTGKDFTPQQAKTAVDIAERVTKATKEAETAKETVLKHLDEATGTKTPPDDKNAPKPTLESDRNALAGHVKGKTMSPEQVKTLWRRAKAYLDAGETDFDNIRHKLAIELGVPVEDVTRGLAQPKGVKAVTDEMYRKMSEQRRIVQAAKTWIKNKQMPGWLRFARNVPRIFFIDKIFGHGTVGMITHAGLNIFNPASWRTYWPNFFRQYRLLTSTAYHERMMQDLIRDPLFVKARRAGLANDPFRYQDDYQGAFHTIQSYFRRLGLGGNRGFDSLKLFRQARFNQIWNDLPASLQTKEMAGMVADSVNHSTGVVAMRFREWANWTFFAPKLEGSRWAWMVGDPLKAAKTFVDWKNSTPEARQFAMSELKQKAYVTGTYLSLLAANQALLSAQNSKQKVNWTDPRRGDFLAFKVDGYNLGLVSPLLGTVRLFANLLHAAAGRRGKVEQISSRSDEIGSTAGSFLRGKFSPFMGFGADIGTQADFQGRPMPFSNDRTPAYLRKQGEGRYTYGEYAAEQFTPIPVEEAVKEVWRSQGMSESQIKVWTRALTTAVVMGGTGARLQADTHQQP